MGKRRVRPPLYYFGSALMRLGMAIFSRLRVIGKENVPLEGSLVVVANHLTKMDPPLLCACLPRPIVFMAKEELFHHWLLGPMVRGYGAFPVRKQQLDRGALRRAIDVLESGLALGMFPEGTRSTTGELQSAYAGSALIALRCGAPILPVGISGTEKMRKLGWVLRPRVTVKIGTPFSLPCTQGKLTRVQMAEYTDVIMGHIAELLPPGYRGVYAKKDAAVQQNSFGVQESQFGD